LTPKKRPGRPKKAKPVEAEELLLVEQSISKSGDPLTKVKFMIRGMLS
jgi:hypothetical protein